MSKEVNYLDIIKRGASRDTSRGPNQPSEKNKQNASDPLGHFAAPVRRDADPHQENASKDYFSRFAPNSESNSRTAEQSRGYYTNRGDDDRSRSPLRQTTGGNSFNKADQTMHSQVESTYRSKSPVANIPENPLARPTYHYTTNNYGETRRASRSPGRVSPAKEISPTDDLNYYRRSASRNDELIGKDATSTYRQSSRSPLRYDEGQDALKSRRTENTNTRNSKYQDSALDDTLKAGAQTFGKYYRDQASARQSVKQTTNEFKRKFREEFERDLKLINSKRQNYIWTSLVVVGAIFLLFIFFLLTTGERVFKPYCDTGTGIIQDGCTPCPANGICEGGRLIECSSDYIKRGNHCYLDKIDDKLVERYYNFALQKLRSVRGEDECNGKSSRFRGLKQDDLENEIITRFGSGSLKAIDKAVEMFNPDNPDTIYEKSDKIYIASAPSFTAVCAVKMFFKAYRYLLTVLLIVIMVALYFIYKLSQELETRRKAANLYKWAEKEINNSADHLMMESSIRRRMSTVHGLHRSEVANLWPYIEKEAQYRQNVEFINKSENGVEERGWWIQSESK